MTLLFYVLTSFLDVQAATFLVCKKISHTDLNANKTKGVNTDFIVTPDDW